MSIYLEIGGIQQPGTASRYPFLITKVRLEFLTKQKKLCCAHDNILLKKHLNVIFETNLFTIEAVCMHIKEYIQEILQNVLSSQLPIIFNHFSFWIHNMCDPLGTLSLSPYWYLTQGLRATTFTLNTNLWWCPL